MTEGNSPDKIEQLRFLQFNCDRGRQATDLAEKKFLEEFDIALIQEPYVRFQTGRAYQRVRVHGDNIMAKAEIWMKANIDITVMLQHTSANYVTIRINAEQPWYVTSWYDEPGGTVNRRVAKFEDQWEVNRRSRHVLAGDANAHCAAWGRDADDARGERLLEWINDNDYVICNSIEQGPTFQSQRGESYIDLTLSRGLAIHDWKVHDEVTFSRHNYITFRVCDKGKEKPKKMISDFDATDWEVFKAALHMLCRARIVTGMSSDEKAVELQSICRRVCTNKIATMEVIGNGNNHWWNE